MTGVAYILAGGHSRRFGADKATWTLSDAGETLLDRTCSALRPHVDEIVVVARTEQLDILEPTLRPEVRCIVDRGPSRGPLSGIDAALTDAIARDGTTVGLVGCDMPWLDGWLIARQLAWLGTSEQLACAPYFDGRWQPLHAAYDTSLYRQVRHRLATEQLRLTDLLDSCDTANACDVISNVEDTAWRNSSRSANTPNMLGEL